MSSDSSRVGAIASPNLLPQLAAFVAVVEAGSFTGAARRTGVDKTLLSRRVQSLEAALQVRLLNRTTRRIHVTEAGKALFDRVRSPLGEVADGLVRAMRGDQARGLIRVGTVPSLGPSLWGPVLEELMHTHPDLEVEIRATETMVNLVEAGYDLAIRMGSLPDSSHIAKRLATWRHILVASPAWARRHPEVSSPADLVGHWILYDDVPMANQWRFERGEEGIEIRVESRIRTDNSEIQLGAVLAGIGVTATAPAHLEGHLRRGELVRLLPDWRVVHQHGIFAVTPHRDYTPTRVEVVRDTVARHVEGLAERWRELTE